MPRYAPLTIFALLVGLLRAGNTQEAPRFHWYYYAIDRNTPVGESTTLVFDKKGHPNIAYGGAEGNKALKFARFDGMEWKVWEINRDRDQAGSKVAMTLDASDVPHIIYQARTCSELKYTWYDGDKWLSQVVDTGINATDCYQISIQADPKGGVHIIYSHGSGTIFAVIAYAYLDSNTSSARNFLDNAGHSGKWNALTFDAQGRPCTAYYAFEDADLGFGFLDGGTWKVEKVDEATWANLQGYYPSMKPGSDDNFYISFQSQTMQKIRLARGQPGAWTVEDIADLNGWATFSTPNPLALDAGNHPYVAFYDLLNADLKLAYKLENVWHTETVDSIGEVGEWASIAMTPEGMPAVSYYDATNGYLRLAIASLTPPPDTDGDAIADYVEAINGTDMRDVDSDDDGIGDGQEDGNYNGLREIHETDPRDPDTDGDGILDGVEVGRANGVAPPPGMQGTDPALFHGDADPNTRTNPLLSDTDGDGLRDSEEDKNVDGRVDLEESDPNNADTDADGLTDGLEARRGTSPLDIDSDDDGLADNEEDKNLNSILDTNETDPSRSDTDNDDLSDGLELGATAPVSDPDGMGKLLATELSRFQPDSDPTTKTDPLRTDTEGDGLKDGDEDKNRNGRFDASETDPLNADTDGDGFRDGTEILAGIDPLDLDSDDDGIADGAEDANQNGVVDAGETSPRIFDSDSDGISDGVEHGLTVGIPDPDGNGSLLGTNGAIFNADADPSINSSPLLWDSDVDGLSDGEEDTNHNGGVDAGETNFLMPDTDADSLSDGDERNFGSDPLDANSKANITLLFTDNFDSPDLQGWSVVDEGNIETPSDWFTYQGALIQTSNIWGGVDSTGGEDPNKPGTYIWANQFEGTNYEVTCTMRSSDDDELGMMFHYRDSNNYYRFSMNRQRHYRRVTKIVDGKPGIIALQEFSYQQDRDYEITIVVVDGKIKVYFDGRGIFNLQDDDLKNGSIAFYCWKDAGALFKEVTITGQGNIVAVRDDQTPLHGEGTIQNFSLSASYPNPASDLTTFDVQVPQSGILRYKVFDMLGRTIRILDEREIKSGSHQLMWNGRNDYGNLVPAGIYFIQLQIAKMNSPDQIQWQTMRKIVRIK